MVLGSDNRGVGRAIFAWLAVAVFFALSSVALAADPERVDVRARSAGEAIDLIFKWATPVDATVEVRARTLTISFARPFTPDLAEIADLAAPFGRFVRLSADGKTLSISLTRALGATGERTPSGWTVHLAPENPSEETPAPKPATPEALAVIGVGDKEEPTPAMPGGAKPAAPTTPELNVSEAADFTRLAFQWPAPVEYGAELVEGELTLRFKSQQEVRLADLRVSPPKRVRTASGELENGGFVVRLKVDPGVALRHAADENYVIIDLVDSADPHGAPEANTKSAAPAAHAENTNASATAGSKAPVAAAPPAVPLLIAAAAQGVAPVTPGGAMAAPQQPAHTISPDTIKSVMSLNDIDASVLESRLKEGAIEREPESGETEEGTAPSEPEPLSVAVAPAMSFAMTVAIESQTVRLGFPWGVAVPATVVRRGDRLWIAFGREAEIDVSAVERVRAAGVSSAETFSAAGATIVGLKLADGLLPTAIPESGGWTIALGDSILVPVADIPLERRLDGKSAEIAARVVGETAKTTFRDPDIRDELVFVMAGAPARGLVSMRRFVDFDLLATIQGLAVRPIADDIDVRLEPDNAVIGRKDGLHIAGTNLVSVGGARAMPDPRASPAEMKFAEWRGPAERSFADGYHVALKNIAAAEDADRTEAQIELAHFLLGYGLNEEALGVLGLAMDEAPQIESQPHFLALRGVANLLANRLPLARDDLDLHELPDDPSTALWLGLLASAQQDFPRSRSFLARAESAIVRLDNQWQARVRLKAAEAGIEINDFGWARSALDLMPTENLKRTETDEAKFLRARLAEAMGEKAKAAAAYEALTHSPIEPVAVRAQLAATLLATRSGELSPSGAIDRLEALRYAWRGDAIEAQTLLALGQIYAKLGDFRHALTTMRIAVRQFPGTRTERRIYGEMADLFEQLFLAGKADQMPPIQALALYFDFKELTPIGPKGDVMIRRLSDRLVAMDLLDQATELLKHQVENRLSGVARSQIAARLALVQLMNHRPEDALVTINKTRQARLPEEISVQRRLIEARALMDLKRYEHANDVISGDVGPASDRLRADIYWHAEDWAKAGPALEAGLAQAFNAPGALTEAQRFDTMRAAISYALGNDRASLVRIKQEYSGKMRGTPDAHGFDVVTSEPGQGSVELYSLAERFAGIDTLADFLGQMKEKDVVEKVN